MILKKLTNKLHTVNHLWRGYGSFGEIKGQICINDDSITCLNFPYRLVCKYDETHYGVICRKDYIENASTDIIHLNAIKSRFVFDGGEYEVYTQYSHWQSENIGAWQPLVTEVVVNGRSVRTNTSAIPFAVLWNKQTQRGFVFHLFPQSAWEISIRREGIAAGNKFSQIVVELGIQDYNFNYCLAPGEKLELPQILCYETDSKIHMDSDKLHRYINEHYPRKQFPMIYNTWMYRFHHIDYDVLARQIKPAADLGLEYFVIDAGWFGKGGLWADIVGDWNENMTGALCGRMIDIANEVRAHGMKFGIWLEPERAMPQADVIQTHGNYYIEENGVYFLDYSREDARKWMLKTIFKLIDHYGIGYIKFDFNEDMFWDHSASSFIKYHNGYRTFIAAIRERYPNIYLSGCAAGGARLNLEGCRLFDSFWPSDHESPKEEMRICKNAMLRIPPNVLEKWAVVQSICNFEPVYEGGTTEHLFACDGATWSDIEGVKDNFLKGYLTGGPIGFSCDLLAISEAKRDMLANHIAQIKSERAFWQSAVCRILVDTPSITVLQYNDVNLQTIVVQVFSYTALQDNICIYPNVDPDKHYRLNNRIVSGYEISKLGVDIGIAGWNEMAQLHLYVVDKE